MTELQTYIKRSDSIDAGVFDFSNDMSARYARRETTTMGQNEEVACYWVIQYATKTATAFTLILLPIMMLAHHGIAPMKKVTLRTFHYLTASELRAMKRKQSLKQLLRLLVMGGILAPGFVLVLSALGILFSLFSTLAPGEKPIPLWPCVGVFVAAALVVAAAIKVQRRAFKVGEPPNAPEFSDTRIRLERADFKQRTA